MANIYDSMNTMQKLAKARLYFLNSKIGKSGKNMQLEFKYFELEDIVPTAIRIFDRVGLVAVDDFGGEIASKTIYNVHNPDDIPVIFQVKNREVDQIISKAGKTVTNPLQALGSSITYLRRYLWMVALDITEPDNIDPSLTQEEEEEQVLPKPKKAAPKPPATPAERKEAKEELVKESSKNATAEQIDLLKSLCRSILTADESKEEFVNQIALETNGFSEIETGACSQLCEYLQAMAEELGVTDAA